MRTVCSRISVERVLAPCVMRRFHLGKITDLSFAPDPVEPRCAPGYVCRSPGGSCFGILHPTLSPPNRPPVLLQAGRPSWGESFSKLPAEGGPPKHAASRRPRESRQSSAACTKLVKPPEANFPWLNLLEPALAFCQASLRWHWLLCNKKIRGLSQASYCSGTEMRQL